MTTHFISAEIDLQETPQQLQQEIEKEFEISGDLDKRVKELEAEIGKAKKIK